MEIEDQQNGKNVPDGQIYSNLTTESSHSTSFQATTAALFSEATINPPETVLLSELTMVDDMKIVTVRQYLASLNDFLTESSSEWFGCTPSCLQPTAGIYI